MIEENRIRFLSEKVKELYSITTEIQEVFPEKSFSLDGILIGNIVEIMAAHLYGITLYKQSEKTHDGEKNGRKVQIKGTQKIDVITVSHKPDYLLVEYLNKENGEISEIYNGPGDLIWEHAKYIPSNNKYSLSVNKLLDAVVPDTERIKPVCDVKKYKKIVTSSGSTDNKKNTKGKTLITGYINKNNQENLGCLNKPGNHYNQKAYKLRCNECGYEYEANGCDIAVRRCPKCQMNSSLDKKKVLIGS